MANRRLDEGAQLGLDCTGYPVEDLQMEEEHLRIPQSGLVAWYTWHQEARPVRVDLNGADLPRVGLHRGVLTEAHHEG
jgi:hypothetical protein